MVGYWYALCTIKKAVQGVCLVGAVTILSAKLSDAAKTFAACTLVLVEDCPSTTTVVRFECLDEKGKLGLRQIS